MKRRVLVGLFFATVAWLPIAEAEQEPAWPDLLPVVFWPDDHCAENGARLTVEIKNDGKAHAPAFFVAVVFERANTVSKAVPDIPKGQSRKVKFDLPDACFYRRSGDPLAKCDFKIDVDARREVGEANEGNNTSIGSCTRK